MKHVLRWVGLSCTALVLGLTGCVTSHPGSSSLAYVELEGTSEQVARDAAVQVFQEEYYSVLKDTEEGILFERAATQADVSRWGRYGEKGMRIQVMVTFESFAHGNTLVRADAFVLRTFGINKAEPITFAGRRPYKKLLDKVEQETQKKK